MARSKAAPVHRALAGPPPAPPFFFSTGFPDGRMGSASRQFAGSKLEIESADDFILNQPTKITGATFYGLLPPNFPTANIIQVTVQIYHVFPLDSTSPPDGRVPTRTNSPSDVQFDDRDSLAGTLAFTAFVINSTFVVQNSVVNGINPSPNQTTGGEGPRAGEEVQFNVTFNPPFNLPANHYFFIPQVNLGPPPIDFLWLSAPKPIVAPGTPFSPDLQSWIRNASLDPDWLRIGTDIVGGATPPTFNAAFSLSGEIICTLTINCPVSITTFTDSGKSTGTVNPGTPQTTDNCASPTVTGVRSDGQPLNAPYPVGVTMISWRANDSNGNTASCGQTITVLTPSGGGYKPGPTGPHKKKP